MEIEAVNRTLRLALTDGGEICHFDSMFDADGDETDASDDAVTAVAQMPDGKWACIYLDEFEPAGSH